MYPDGFDDIIINNRQEFEELPEHFKVAYCIYILEQEVNNGGFDQFFFNPSGSFTQDTVMALDTIKATKTAKILKQAIDVAYPKGFPSDPAKHQEDLAENEDTCDELEELDDQFFKYEDDLAELVNRYLDKFSN